MNSALCEVMSDETGKTVILRYRSVSEKLSIQESSVPPHGIQPRGELVTVRGRQSELREYGFGRSLASEEEGVLISIFGQLSKEAMLAVAETLR